MSPTQGWLRAGMLLIITAVLALGCAEGRQDDGTDPVDGSCPDPRVLCDLLCVDVDVDIDNCGRCGRTCSDDQVCQTGFCVDACPSNQSYCEEACVDPLSDAGHCGGCGNPCGGNESCQAGMCRCSPGFRDCGGSCVDLSTDAHCGDCGNACKIGEACISARCEPVCAGTTTSCGGACVDTLTNTSHCGGCERPCERNQACEGGDCACAGDRDLCGGECVDTSTNSEYCGSCTNACPTGVICRDSACVCPTGSTLCDGQCVDTNRNAQFCGNCDTDCGAGVCANGLCASECPNGQNLCEDGCADLATDLQNCLVCGTSCRADQECGGSGCACPAGFLECEGRCVDVTQNPSHCGQCMRSCSEGQTCENRECGCGDGEMLCGEACIDTDRSNDHCGDCDNPCVDGETCATGDCVCADTYILCDDQCVQTNNNPDFCGNCETACSDGEVCLDGSCETDCALPTIECDGSCVDVSSDRRHCGDCTTVCDYFEACTDHTCSCQDDFHEPSDSISDIVYLDAGWNELLAPHVSDLRLCDEDTDWYSYILPVEGSGVTVLMYAECGADFRPRISVWTSDGVTQLAADETTPDTWCPEVTVPFTNETELLIKVESLQGEGDYYLEIEPLNVFEVEPNDDPDNANGLISSDIEIIAETTPLGSDIDTFEFYAPRHSTVRIWTDDALGSCETDTGVEVYDGADLSEYDDNSGSGSCSYLEVEVEIGFFWVTVYGFLEDGTTGAYQLNIDFQHFEEIEPNGELTPDGPFSTTFGAAGTIFPPEDADYYEIVLTSVGTIRAEVLGNGFGCTLDSVLELVSADDLSELGGNDDFENPAFVNTRGGGYCSLIDPDAVGGPDQEWARDLPAGRYWLILTGFGLSTGAYSLDVEIDYGL